MSCGRRGTYSAAGAERGERRADEGTRRGEQRACQGVHACFQGDRCMLDLAAPWRSGGANRGDEKSTPRVRSPEVGKRLRTASAAGRPRARTGSSARGSSSPASCSAASACPGWSIVIATAELLAWRGRPDRKPLVIRGARQVGKTHLVESFGRASFAHLVSLDFEREPLLGGEVSRGGGDGSRISACASPAPLLGSGPGAAPARPPPAHGLRALPRPARALPRPARPPWPARPRP